MLKNEFIEIRYKFFIDGYYISVKSNKNIEHITEVFEELQDYNINTMLEYNSIWHIETIKETMGFKTANYQE